jgi:predicted nucleotidyltransferase
MSLTAETFSQEQLVDVCQRFGVQRLALFGSVLRGDARADSDVDLLVEFMPEGHPTYFTLVDLAEQLSPVFGGRRVDLVTPRALHRLIRGPILRTAKVLYEG